MPVDHLAGAYLEKVGKCISIKDPFIGPLGTLSSGQAVQTHGWNAKLLFHQELFWGVLGSAYRGEGRIDLRQEL